MKKISFVLAASVAALMGSGNALAQNANALTTTPDVIVYAAGSSAQKTNLDNAIKAVCQTGTFEKYTNALGGDHFITYYCLSQNIGSGVQDGTKIMVRYSGYTTVIGNTSFAPGTSAGGSILGANPVINQSKIQFMAVSPATAALCNTTTAGVCDDSKTGLVDVFVPQLGLTDLHPKWFVLQNAPVEAGATQAPGLTKLKITPGIVTPFNTPVSLNLRDALQASQIKSGALAAGCATTPELGSCTPSLTASQLADIWTGAVTSWDKVDANLQAKPVTLVRREIGSGTQASLMVAVPSKMYGDLSKAYPCTTGAQPTVLNGKNVILGAATGDIETALVNANQNGDYAIGLVSAPRNGAGADAAAVKNYRIIKIDGKAPTMTDIASGAYKFVTQGTFQRLSVGAGTASEVAVLDAIVTNMLTPSVIAIGNASATSKLNVGDSGYMAVTDGASCTAATCATNPVTNVRFAKNAADYPNNCAAPTSSW